VLVWMDLEMTGLDPRRDRVVEIATLVTDDGLDVIAEGPDLVIATPPEALAAMDEVVRQMHTRSGLLDAISASTIPSNKRPRRPSPSSASTSPRPARSPCAATRSHRPPLPGRLHARNPRTTSTTVASTCLPSRNWPSAGTPDALAAAPEARSAPGARRHQRERRGAEVLEKCYFREKSLPIPT